MPKMVERVCRNKQCAGTFVARAADVARGWAKFCSKRCKAIEQENRTGQYAGFQHRERERQDGDCEGPGWDAHKGYN